eukprot:evm.model.scf_255EXC.7 EVM.evm.TU.scf_255EXC.7   scf_255EXC:67990-95901(+)
MEDCTALLRSLEAVDFGGGPLNLPHLEAQLRAVRGSLIDLLNWGGPSAEARREVEAGRVQTGHGLVTLAAADAMWAFRISHRLNLNEKVCVELCVQAGIETGEASEDGTLGIYFERRRALLTVLKRLLEMDVGKTSSANPDAHKAVREFTRSLLAEEADGKGKVLSRVVALIQDASSSIQSRRDQEDSSQSGRSMVRDFLGQEQRFSACLIAERRLLCEILLLAVRVRPSITPQAVIELMDLLRYFQLQMTVGMTAGHCEPAHLQGGALVLFSMLTTLMPDTDSQEGPQRDEESLHQLTRNAEVQSVLEGDPTHDEPLVAVVRLAWGLLCATYLTPNEVTFQQLVDGACEAGVFGFLNATLSDECLEDLQPDLREICADKIFMLMHLYLEKCHREFVKGRHPMVARSRELYLVSIRRHGTVTTRGDRMGTLLDCIASVFALKPPLAWSDEPAVSRFVGWVPTCDLLARSPEVFVAFIGVFTAVATSELGARAMYQQFECGNAAGLHDMEAGYKFLQFKYIMWSLKEFSESIAKGGTPGPDDMKGITAYMEFLRMVLSQGSPKEVPGWIEQLEGHLQECGSNAKLHSRLLALLCVDVSHTMKAAINGLLAALANDPNRAAAILQFLQANTMVTIDQPLSADSAQAPKYDLLYQVNQIEAGAGEFPQTVSFIRLLNCVLKSSRPVQHQAAGVAGLTKFVRDAVLGRLWNLRFKSTKQKWEVAEAAFDLMRLVFEEADFSKPPDPHSAMPPGFIVMQDILGGGVILRAVGHVLSFGVEEGPRLGLQLQCALLSAFRLLAAVMAKDREYVEHANVRGTDTVDKVLVQSDRRTFAILAEYIRSGESTELQMEALGLLDSLVRRNPRMVDLFGGVSVRGSLRQAVAVALNSGLSMPDAVDDNEGSGMGRGDCRALIVIRMLWQCLKSSGPNVAHLLLGYDVTRAARAMGPNVLAMDGGTSCFGVILDAIRDIELATSKPGLFKLCLEVMQMLCTASSTVLTTLKALRDSLLMEQLDQLLFCDSLDPLTQLATRTFTMKILTAELLCVDPTVPEENESAKVLIHAMFCDASSSEAEVEPRIVQVLADTDLFRIPSPQLGEYLTDRAKALLDMYPRVVHSLTDREQGRQVGARSVSHNGKLLFDEPKVKSLLLSWFSSHLPDWDDDTAKIAAGREAMEGMNRFIMAENDALRQGAEMMDMLCSTQYFVEACFGRHFPSVVEACEGVDLRQYGSTMLTTMEIIHHCLLSLAVVHTSHAEPLCQIVQSLMSHLCKQADRLGAAAAGLMLSHCGPDLFQLLVRHILDPNAAREQVRMPLVCALLWFLALLNNPDNWSTERTELGSELQLRIVGFVQSQAHKLVESLASDVVALKRERALRILSLEVLAAFVTIDSSSAVAQVIASKTGILRDIADGLGGRDYDFAKAGDISQALLLKAQLGLILRILMAGGPGRQAKSAQMIYSVGVIQNLTNSPLLEGLPNNWVPWDAVQMECFIRLQPILVVLFRVVLGILLGVPGSRNARRDVKRLVDKHRQHLATVILLAGSQGEGMFPPGHDCVKLASLIVHLLTQVGVGTLEPETQALLHQAIERLQADLLHGTGRWGLKHVLALYFNRLLGPQSAEERCVSTSSPVLLEECTYQSLRDSQGLAESRGDAWELLQVPEASRDQTWVKRGLLSLGERETSSTHPQYVRQEEVAIRLDAKQSRAEQDVATLLRTVQVGFMSLESWYAQKWRGGGDKENYSLQLQPGLPGRAGSGQEASGEEASPQDLARAMLRELEPSLQQLVKDLHSQGLREVCGFQVRDLEASWSSLREYLVIEAPRLPALAMGAVPLLLQS